MNRFGGGSKLSATLSVCMIVKNEAKNIATCLKSILSIADEIIVVDTGSIDATKSIAKEYGAKLYDFEWIDDFSKARNFSIDKATGDWILILDGDDELEVKDAQKLSELINSEDAGDIYIFNTICYVGDRVGSDKIMNVNLRLFRNWPEFRYQGRIHESIMTQNPQVRMRTSDITIYHYGYLNDFVKDQNKRERNMRILEEQIKDAPENPYFLFCMGNEYFALSNYDKALEYFLSAYQRCNIQDVYVPKLMIRIIMAYQGLGRFSDALKYIEDALSYYPQYTDAEFIRGGIYHKSGNYIKAMKSFQRCLDLGEPPSMLNFIIGVGTYRAYYALGSVLHQMGDLEEALKSYNQAILLKNDFYDAVYGIGSIITKIYSKPEDIKQHLEQYFSPNSGDSYAMIADILFLERKYELSLAYMNAALKLNVNMPELLFLRAKCMYNLKMYEEASREFEKVDRANKYYLNSQTMLLLCYYILEKFEAGEQILDHIGQIDNYEKIYKLFLTLGNILQSKEKEILSNDIEESKEYLILIVDTLDAILCTGEFELFEKALELFNCIENDEVLMALAKLYNKYGFVQQAVKEIKRSICIFDKLDEESAYILYRSYSLN